MKAQRAITPIRGAFAPEYKAILDYWTLQGYTLPTRSCQIKQNKLVQQLKLANAWNTADFIRVWQYDGVDDNLIYTNWANVNTFNGTLNGTLSRVNNLGLKTLGGYFKNEYIPSIDGINYNKNDFMKVIVPFRQTGTIDLNNGMRNTAATYFIFVRQLTGIVEDFAANDVTFSPITFDLDDIVFYGRQNSNTTFSKINQNSVNTNTVVGLGDMDNYSVEFMRNEATPVAGYSVGASDSSGSGYKFIWWGKYSTVNLDLFYKAINNYLL